VDTAIQPLELIDPGNRAYIGPALDPVKDIRHVNPVLSAYRPASRYSLGFPPQVITEEDTAHPNISSIPPLVTLSLVPGYSLGFPPQVITEEDTAHPTINSIPPPVSAGGGGCSRAWPKWTGHPEPATDGRGGGGSGDRGGTGVQQRQGHPRHRHCGKFIMPKELFLKKVKKMWGWG
jgi:hypothetical protein